MNPFIKQGHITLISSKNVKAVIMLQKSSISNKCCSFELSVHQRVLKKWHGFHKNIKRHTTVFITGN